MKKTIFYILLILTIAIGVFTYNIFFSHVKSNEILIENFLKTTIDSLNPDNGKAYSLRTIKVKGHINDSIIIRGFYGYPIYLIGRVDEEFNSEYYGSYPSVIKIDSYKAKSGKLKVIHAIR